MKTIVTAAMAAAALAAVCGAGAASAQGRGRPSITLFEGVNYQGQSRSYSAEVVNLADQGFNDRAQSLRVEGRWRVCEDARFRGRCVEVSGDVPNLAGLRLMGAISSIEDLNRGGGGGGPGPGPGPGFGPGPGGGPGPGYGPGPGGPGGGSFAGQSLDGRTVSFFPRPQPGPYRNADEFCRRLGFNGVVYADDRGPQLRDVVCRR